MGRRRIARTPLHSNQSTTSVLPPSMSSSQLAPPRSEAQTNTVSTRAGSVERAGSVQRTGSCQSPLDQILVDQRRMFVSQGSRVQPPPPTRARLDGAIVQPPPLSLDVTTSLSESSISSMTSSGLGAQLSCTSLTSTETSAPDDVDASNDVMASRLSTAAGSSPHKGTENSALGEDGTFCCVHLIHWRIYGGVMWRWGPPFEPSTFFCWSSLTC